MAIQIVTDSTSDLPLSLQKQYGIHLIPLQVLFGEHAYLDGVNLSKEERGQLKEKCADEASPRRRPSGPSLPPW